MMLRRETISEGLAGLVAPWRRARAPIFLAAERNGSPLACLLRVVAPVLLESGCVVFEDPISLGLAPISGRLGEVGTGDRVDNTKNSESPPSRPKCPSKRPKLTCRCSSRSRHRGTSGHPPGCGGGSRQRSLGGGRSRSHDLLTHSPRMWPTRDTYGPHLTLRLPISWAAARGLQCVSLQLHRKRSILERR
jgi:hypothetical protein